MPTLEELRQWLQGESIDGMPAHRRKQDAPPQPPAVAGAKPSKQYKINTEGTDALLLFGKQFNGQRLSEIVRIPRGRKYILWILDRDFDEAFKAVCRYQMELYKRAK